MSRVHASIAGALTAGALLLAPACDDPPKAQTKTAKADADKPTDKALEKDAPDKVDKPQAEAKAGDAADSPEDAAAEGEAPAGAGEGEAEGEGEGEGQGEAAEGDAAAEGGGGSDVPSVPAGDAGAAYFAIDHKGVFAIDGGEVKPVKKAPDKLVQQMSLGPDGAAYLLGFDAVMKLDKDTATTVVKTAWKKTGTTEAFAVTADGGVWVAGFKGVAFHDGKKWTAEDKATIGADVKLLRGIVVDKDGRPWVASSNDLHVKEGDAWKTVDLGTLADHKPFFDTITTDPSTGSVYASARSLLVQATAPDNVSQVTVASQGLSSLGLVAFAQNGVGALKTDAKHVARLAEGNQTSFELGKDFAGTRVHQLSVDGKGRVWVATDIGIAVLGPGAERVEWKSGSIPALAGRVRGLVVVGAGPELPEVGEVHKGALKGRILLDAKALPSAEIEMCPEPSTMIDNSPCEKSPTKFTGKTAEDGGFEFADVPLGAYGIAVKLGDKWKTTMSGQLGTKMKEGETFDVGALQFKTK